MTDSEQHGASRTLDVQCCVVGGGPAGMMLGYLLGRAGIETVVLEKHADFFRDFRGDTVHPSTLEVMDELGLIDDFLKLRHDKLQKLEGYFGQTKLRLADISRTGAKHPFIAFMPQWDFLNFLRDKGQRYPKFKVLMSTEATDLIWANRAVCGVEARDTEGPLAINANLVVACDGRHSTVRVCAGLNVEEIGAPMDVLWFRVGKGSETEGVLARIETGQMMITLDRGDYWQCAYVIAKGQYDTVKARGLDAFRANICHLAPILTSTIADIKSWDDVKLLSVSLDRLTRWHRPGLLAIGDAAHAMSPVGGVGINLAIQDAVAAANILAAAMAAGQDPDPLLEKVQARRMLPVRVVQAIQRTVHRAVLEKALAGEIDRAPLVLRILDRVALLRRIPARVLGLGVRREHIRSPAWSE
ncbi:MAG: FAD-dependent oxidoreductase [Rhizobiales bacterium]|nr:FAD-dependent oxidoreductase [Hyphomicrobiales bacterium]